MTNVYKNNLNYLCRKIIPTVMFLFLQQGKNVEKIMSKRLLPLGSLARMLHYPECPFSTTWMLSKQGIDKVVGMLLHMH